HRTVSISTLRCSPRCARRRRNSASISDRPLTEKGTSMSDPGQQNLSEPAAYSGIAAELAQVVTAGKDGLGRFREVLVKTEELGWSPKTLPGLSQRMLW